MNVVRLLAKNSRHETQGKDKRQTSSILYGPSVSAIVPAFNEAGCLPEILKRLHLAEDHFKASVDGAVEIVVVDNASTDRTVEVAQSARARVVHQQAHNSPRCVTQERRWPCMMF